MRHQAILIAAACTAVGTLQAQDSAQASAPAPLDTAAAIAAGQKATDLFYAGRMDSLWTMLTPGFQEGIESQQWLTDRLGMVMGRAGLETRVVEESIKMRGGKPQYWRVAEFSSMPEPLLLRWVIAPDGRISGLGMGPLSQAPPTDDEQP